MCGASAQRPCQCRWTRRQLLQCTTCAIAWARARNAGNRWARAPRDDRRPARARCSVQDVSYGLGSIFPCRGRAPEMQPRPAGAGGCGRPPEERRAGQLPQLSAARRAIALLRCTSQSRAARGTRIATAALGHPRVAAASRWLRTSREGRSARRSAMRDGGRTPALRPGRCDARRARSMRRPVAGRWPGPIRWPAPAAVLHAPCHRHESRDHTRRREARRASIRTFPYAGRAQRK